LSVIVTERGYSDSCVGRVLQLKVWAPGYPVLGFCEVWRAFTDAYPGRWALQVFPPADSFVDGKNVYHLWVLDSEPEGLNLR